MLQTHISSPAGLSCANILPYPVLNSRHFPPLACSTRVASEAFDELRQQNAVETALLPSIGGLTTGVLALGYPEILYQVCRKERKYPSVCLSELGLWAWAEATGRDLLVGGAALLS